MKTTTTLLLTGTLLILSLNAGAQPDTGSTFTKITEGPIVTDGGSSYGCSWGDYDNDGFIDLVVANGWGQQAFLYRNNRDGTFAKITTGPVVGDSGGDGTAPVWGDYDNDGFIDLFVSNTSPPRNFLYHNNGDGTFAKITTGLIVNDTNNSVGAAWADYNRDGWLDLFVSNSLNQNDSLYRGNGDGTFTSITSGPVVTSGGTSLGCAWGDADNDGDPDLVVANRTSVPLPNPIIGQNDFYFRNDGSGVFTRITTGPVVTDATISSGIAWGDYDNDGDLDLVMTSRRRENDRLYRNLGGGNFELVSTSVVSTEGQAGNGCAWGDYDNDGWLDLFVTGFLTQFGFRDPHRLYRNRGDGTFEVITDSVLIADSGYAWGCAWGDYNNDGFLDLFVANNGDDDFNSGVHWNNDLYRNNGNFNGWLMFKLVGTASNRSAIGAKVRLKATIAGQTFWQMREISGGSGYCSQNDMRAHFGLGDATNASLVRIEWPSGTVQELRNVAANQILTVKEPPVLTGLSRSGGGGSQFTLKGGRGTPYTVEYSTNLMHWRALTNFTATNITTTVHDPNATSAPSRFYRAWEGD
jgi:hypothetical protein